MILQILHHARLAVTLLGFVKMILTSSILKKNFAKPGLLVRLQPFQCREYEVYFRATYEAFRNGRVAETQKGRGGYCKNRCSLVRPLGV